jgi:hypothetical protein
MPKETENDKPKTVITRSKRISDDEESHFESSSSNSIAADSDAAAESVEDEVTDKIQKDKHKFLKHKTANSSRKDTKKNSSLLEPKKYSIQHHQKDHQHLLNKSAIECKVYKPRPSMSIETAKKRTNVS